MLDALQRSQGIGHVPQWHRDIDDPHTYRRQGYAMFVIDDPDAPGEILACGGLRPARPIGPPEVRRRASLPTTAELVRFATATDHLRRGLASSVLEHVMRHAREETPYEWLTLHTNARSAGAVGFWLAQGATIVADTAQPGDDPRLPTVYLEFPRWMRA